MAERVPYFEPQDFAAFAHAKVQSDDQEIMRQRRRVVEKFRTLHEDGLGWAMQEHGLFPHWRTEHLTNVYWPSQLANGGWVDHLRMGYGKEERLVRELARRAGVYTELQSHGTYEHMAFHYVTQIQVGLGEASWWVDLYLYLDDKAWLELRNLVRKLQDRRQRSSNIVVGRGGNLPERK